MSNYGFTWNLDDEPTAAWYPAVGSRNCDSGVLNSVGSGGYYWSASPNPIISTTRSAYHLFFHSGNVLPANLNNRSFGYSVRCVKE